MPWFFAYNGQQIGPLDDLQAQSQARVNPHGLVWRDGFAQWMPIQQVAELFATPAPSPISPQGPVDSPATFPSNGGAFSPAGREVADEVDYRIVGSEMQFVEIELDPGESAVAEAGAMMYKAPEIQMDTLFGDGSRAVVQGGFMDKLVGAGKRLLTGESLFMTVFTHTGQGKAHVAFGAPYPGNIIPLSLDTVNGTLICQKDCFLCAAKGVSIGIHFQRKILTGLFGGEGFIMQRLSGRGIVFLELDGTVVEKDLAPGERLKVDTGNIALFESNVNYDVETVKGFTNVLFGGEGLFLSVVQGPGKVWLQSINAANFAAKLNPYIPHSKG